MKNNIDSVGIVGGGKVGVSLCMSFLKIRKRCWLLTSSEKSEQFSKSYLNESELIIKKTDSIPFVPDIIFLAVPDTQLKTAAAETEEKLSSINQKLILSHCSGTRGFNVFEGLENPWLNFAITHPYQTFYYPADNLLEDTAWAVDTEPEHFDRISGLLNEIGSKAFNISLRDEKTRSLYHESAVVASNYMNLLIYHSLSSGKTANIPVDEFLPAILKTTLKNNLKNISEKNEIPLTGPIARKDIEAVRLHLENLAENIYLLKSYIHLTYSSAVLALDKEIIDSEFYSSLIKLLNEYENKCEIK